MYCPKCGKEIADGSKFCEICGASFNNGDIDAINVFLKFAESQLTTLLIGIISVVMSIPVLIQGISGMAGSLFSSSENSGGAGFGFAAMLIMAGWVVLSTRHNNDVRKGGAMVAAVLYGIGFILGLIAGVYLYSVLALLFGVICVFCFINLNSKG
jgi:hypothetical protein